MIEGMLNVTTSTIIAKVIIEEELVDSATSDVVESGQADYMTSPEGYPSAGTSPE